MANYPQPIKQREELNLRLGIKSSLSQLRSVVASLYVIYKANAKQSSVIYSKEISSNGLISTKLDDTLSQKISDLFNNSQFATLVEQSPLFTSQLEALQVGIELFFHLGKINFVASGLSERTGSSRYQKQIAFATNMILVDLYLSSHSTEDVNKLLLSWLKDEPFQSKLEDGLRIMLNTFTEETQYKIRDNNSEEVVFNQEGVYLELLNSDAVASNDTKEPVGPFRVYKSYLTSGLHPFVNDNRQLITLKDNVKSDTLKRYADMVDTTLSLIPQRVIVTQEEVQQNTEQDIVPTIENLPLQVIYFGAPGTGKSHAVKEITEQFGEEAVIRTTFHPDSDYSTFVGCYKPTKMLKPVRNVAGDIVKANGKEVFEESITYAFTPQAFTQAYTRAWENPDKEIFLVIEEINRGNCAQIFGDIFQLLDRGDDGMSEYAIIPDHDLQNYLAEEFANHTDLPEEIRTAQKLRLPRNLHIWATMNTSDQSLFPIDSAFKRRWEWRYIKIAKPVNKETGKPFDWKLEGDTDWWQFLKKINAIINKMTNSADKQLGYFFAKADETGEIKYDRFVAKVCFYLWNDIFKTYAMDDVETDLFKFTYTGEEGNERTGKLNFTEFFDENGKVVPAIVQQFISNVMNWND